MDVIVSEMVRCIKRAQLNPVRSMQKWMEQEFIIPDGKHQGLPIQWDTQPVAKLLVQEIDSGIWNEVFVTGPSQSGKTLIGFVAPALYHTLERGEKFVLGIPDMRMADNKFQLDLKPAILANARLARLLPKSGPGSQGGIVRDTVTFLNGGLIKFMSAGGSDQQRAGFTTRVVGVTEAARFSRVSETSREADPLRQIRARQASYDEHERMLYVEGTVTIEEDLPWSARSESSQSVLVSQCPHCGEWISPERENLLGWKDAVDAFEAGENARWFCYRCGESIDDQQRADSVRSTKLLHAGQSINKRGEITGPRPRTNRLFFRYTGWHNLFVSTATLAREEWKADQIDHESIEYENGQKELCQFKWCVPYKPNNLESQPLESKAVRRRAKDSFPKGVLPPDTTHTAVGCDVGKYWLHYVLLAGRMDGSMHVPDYGSIEVPSAFMDWEQAIAQAISELMDLCETGWLHRLENQIKEPGEIWIDKNYEPDGVVKGVIARCGKPKRRSRVQVVLGRGSGQLQRIYQAPPKVGGGVIQIGHHWHMSLSKRFRCCEIFVDSDHWKDRIHDAFKIERGTPGSLTLYQAPEREHSKFSKHITNEFRKVEFVPGRGEVVTFEKHGANHWLDALYYARASLDRQGWMPQKTTLNKS